MLPPSRPCFISSEVRCFYFLLHQQPGAHYHTSTSISALVGKQSIVCLSAWPPAFHLWRWERQISQITGIRNFLPSWRTFYHSMIVNETSFLNFNLNCLGLLILCSLKWLSCSDKGLLHYWELNKHFILGPMTLILKDCFSLQNNIHLT